MMVAISRTMFAWLTALSLLMAQLEIVSAGQIDREQARAPTQQSLVPLPAAHAHNDYWHDRPLLDALSHGFCSVEADVFLVDNQLLVGHEKSELRQDQTLQALYLDPLKKRIVENGGHAYAEGPPLTLLIDIKTDGATTYKALHQLLSKYSEILTTVRDGKTKQGEVTVVISGNRPTELLSKQPVRYAGVDGRLSDLDSTAPVDRLPLLSDNWRLHFQWRGEGEMPDAERRKLADIVAKAHAAGRRVRFWATPETPAMWRELDAAGVDLISTDDLDGLQEFLLSRQTKGRLKVAE